MWTDAHCHVPWEGVGEDVLDDARAAGVTRFVTVGTDAASSSTAAASSITPRPSRSHCTAAPVTKMAPSRAYEKPPAAPRSQATVVSRPATGSGQRSPMFARTKLPVP